jgi:hypothetical protein
MEHPPGELTDLLRRVERGDSGAADALFAATYDDLRRLARGRLRAAGMASPPRHYKRTCAP